MLVFMLATLFEGSSVLHRPQKKKKPILAKNPRLEAHLPLFSSCTIFCNSANTPATPVSYTHLTLPTILRV